MNKSKLQVDADTDSIHTINKIPPSPPPPHFDGGGDNFSLICSLSQQKKD